MATRERLARVAGSTPPDGPLAVAVRDAARFDRSAISVRAGLLAAIPQAFFREEAKRLRLDGARDLRAEDTLAVGVLFIFESDPATILQFLKADARRDAGHLRPLMRDEAWTQLQALWPRDGLLAPLETLRPWAALIVAPTLLQQVVEGVDRLHELHTVLLVGEPLVHLQERHHALLVPQVPRRRHALPVAFAPTVIEAAERAASAQHYRHMRLPSGAFHDAQFVVPVCPTGMIFVPCHKGISHNPAEYSTPAQLAKGARVLHVERLRPRVS